MGVLGLGAAWHIHINAAVSSTQQLQFILHCCEVCCEEIGFIIKETTPPKPDVHLRHTELLTCFRG